MIGAGLEFDPSILVYTTIATVTSQTVFTMTTGSADDDVYNDQDIIFRDQTTSTQVSIRLVSDYTGSTKTVTLQSAPDFTIAAGDLICIKATNANSAIATAQADLDTITGSDGATLATTQSAITWGAQTISVVDATNNITLSGSGSGDGLAFTRSGSGSLFESNWSTDFQAEANAACDTAISDAALATAANLATVDTNVDAILVDTATTIPGQITALNNISVSDLLTTQMTEAYAADGTAPTLAQALFQIMSFLQERAVSGTTLTCKQLDGSTTSMTFTLDDATSPTSITRAT